MRRAPLHLPRTARTGRLCFAGSTLATLPFSLLLLAGLARPAGAAQLEAHGPAECADAAELSFRVERSLGAPLASAAPLRFEVLMQRGVDAYVARIRLLDGGSGNTAKERVLSAADCGKLADAVSVAIALALGEAESIDWHVESEAAAPASESPQVVPVAAEPAAADDGAAEAPEETPADAWVPALSAWFLADAGSLPAPGLGVAIGAELGVGRLRLRALGTLLFEQHTTLETATLPEAGADLQLMAGSLLACTAPFGAARAELTTLACLGLEVGSVSGTGSGVPQPRSGSALWVAPRLDAGLVWSIPASALQLSANLTAATPLNRDEFALTGIGTVHEPPSIIGRIGLGLGVVFD